MSHVRCGRDAKSAEELVVVFIAAIGKLLIQARSNCRAVRQTDCALHPLGMVIRPEGKESGRIGSRCPFPRRDMEKCSSYALPRIGSKAEIPKVTCVAVVAVGFDVVCVEAAEGVGPIEFFPGAPNTGRLFEG